MPILWHGPGLAGASVGSGGPDLAGERELLVRLRLWPHRSLSEKGFAAVIGLAFGLFLLPLLTVLGTPVLWGLLPFVLLALFLLWTLLRKSSREAEITEELWLWPDRAELVRRQPGVAPRRWEADPYWISVQLYPRGGPVENYLTLRGGGREVELGAFLTAEERQDLRPRLEAALRLAVGRAHTAHAAAPGSLQAV